MLGRFQTYKKHLLLVNIVADLLLENAISASVKMMKLSETFLIVIAES